MKSDKGSLRKFGITMAAAFMVITLLIFLDRKHSILLLATLSTAFLFFGLTLPLALKPVYNMWMRLAYLLAWVNTRLILCVLFYLVFTPTGLVMRLFGKDPLDRKIDKGLDTYWIKKEARVSDYERQF